MIEGTCIFIDTLSGLMEGNVQLACSVKTFGHIMYIKKEMSTIEFDLTVFIYNIFLIFILLIFI